MHFFSVPLLVAASQIFVTQFITEILFAAIFGQKASLKHVHLNVNFSGIITHVIECKYSRKNPYPFVERRSCFFHSPVSQLQIAFLNLTHYPKLQYDAKKNNHLRICICKMNPFPCERNKIINNTFEVRPLLSRTHHIADKTQVIVRIYDKTVLLHGRKRRTTHGVYGARLYREAGGGGLCLEPKVQSGVHVWNLPYGSHCVNAIERGVTV